MNEVVARNRRIGVDGHEESRRLGRIVVVDVMTLAFCAFFAWKSWTLFHEAWVDKMTTSSTFSPPLTIPYGLMAAGMTLLVGQLLTDVFSTESLLHLRDEFRFQIRQIGQHAQQIIDVIHRIGQPAQRHAHARDARRQPSVDRDAHGAAVARLRVRPSRQW